MLAELQKKGRVTNFEAKTVTHTGRHIDLLFSAKQIGNDIFGMAMDITRRKQAELKNIGYQQRLKTLASQLTIAVEKERRTIAAGLQHYRFLLAMTGSFLGHVAIRQRGSERRRLSTQSPQWVPHSQRHATPPQSRPSHLATVIASGRLRQRTCCSLRVNG